jgi:hypothetical protein
MFWIVNPSQMASQIPKLSIAVFSSGPGQYGQWPSLSNVVLILAAANNYIYLTCYQSLILQTRAGAEEGKALHYAVHPFRIDAVFVCRGAKVQVQ